ncbi:MAG: MarC family protein [Planctomycetota bacterium]
MDELFGRFVLLFTVIDPIESVPVFIAATVGIDAALARRFAIRSAFIAAGILVGALAAASC